MRSYLLTVAALHPPTMPETGFGHSPTPPPAVAVVERISCAAEFAEDERTLRAGGPAVRVAVLSERALSYGVGVRDDAGFVARARAEGIPVVRRTSGGTGVLHEAGDLAWSVVLPREHPAVGRDYARAYHRLGAGVVDFLDRRGLHAEWSPAPGVSDDCCVLSGRGRVLTLGPSILGGAAQHLTRTALLHQGMIARGVDRSATARLFALTEPDALSRLAGIEELGVTDSPGRLARELAREIARSFDLAVGPV